MPQFHNVCAKSHETTPHCDVAHLWPSHLNSSSLVIVHLAPSRKTRPNVFRSSNIPILSKIPLQHRQDWWTNGLRVKSQRTSGQAGAGNVSQSSRPHLSSNQSAAHTLTRLSALAANHISFPSTANGCGFRDKSRLTCDAKCHEILRESQGEFKRALFLLHFETFKWDPWPLVLLLQMGRNISLSKAAFGKRWRAAFPLIIYTYAFYLHIKMSFKLHTSTFKRQSFRMKTRILFCDNLCTTCKMLMAETSLKDENTCAATSELTCSFTQWIEVTAAPLWSSMTRVTEPSARLLTTTTPSLPADRITWPVTKEGQKTFWKTYGFRQNIERVNLAHHRQSSGWRW